MNQLTKYDAARYALSVAVEVDEVKEIRDKAEAMAAYARQAKDTELVQWATEIKVRAERRAGQMLADMPKQNGGHAAKARSHDVTEVPKTLADIGITKNESSRWQKLAAVSDEQFEHAVAAAKEVAGEVTTAAMLRAAKAGEPQETATVAPAKLAPETGIPVTAPVIALEPEYTPLDAANDQIAGLQDQLAATIIGGASDDDKENAQTLLTDLRQRIKTLEATLKAVTLSRDTYMNENAELRKQITRQRKEIDKATGKRTA